MSVPDYQSFMRPLLAFGADGQEKNIRAAIDALADEFHLTPEDRLLSSCLAVQKHCLLIGALGSHLS
jgi:restriction endonuclease Mrr